MHRTDPSGLGFMQCGLFESVWLGPQAFYGASAFNENIGAWNTASMTTMASVCPHCHRQRVRTVCFMLASVLDSFLDCFMRT
jgi:surface protein